MVFFLILILLFFIWRISCWFFCFVMAFILLLGGVNFMVLEMRFLMMIFIFLGLYYIGILFFGVINCKVICFFIVRV